MAGARETSCFGGQVQRFGHGRDRRRSDFVTVAVNRDFWTCGSFADFVAGAAHCEPRSADFVAGTAL